jgi:serum/glucocorticoid-regulated kinase 2
LGAKGFHEIKNHPFFATIDFELLIKKKINAPFKPEISNKLDVQNFDEDFTSEEVSQTPIPTKNLDSIKKNQDKFKEF